MVSFSQSSIYLSRISYLQKETTEDSLNSMKNTDDEIKDYGLDSVVAQKKESGSIEEKKEVDYVKREVDDAIKHGVSTEEVISKGKET